MFVQHLRWIRPNDSGASISSVWSTTGSWLWVCGLRVVPHRDGDDDDAEADAEHDRRRDHEAGWLSAVRRDALGREHDRV